MDPVSLAVLGGVVAATTYIYTYAGKNEEPSVTLAAIGDTNPVTKQPVALPRAAIARDLLDSKMFTQRREQIKID